MKTNYLFSIAAAGLLFLSGCANDDAAQGGDWGEDGVPAGSTLFSGAVRSATRTVISNHMKNGSAQVSWSAGDKIWVKDDGNAWRQSGAASIPAYNKSRASFALSGTYTGASHEVVYTNKPVSGTQPQVEIKSAQTQSAPNNFDHAGASGDCAVARATKYGARYEFTLDHKAAYLCLIPRSTDIPINGNIRLTKITVASDDDIAGTYDIASDGTLTLASGGSKTITLTLGDYPLDNTADDQAKNAAYMVIKPGMHDLVVKYTITDPSTNASLDIPKYIGPRSYDAGKISDLTANLVPNNYYQWGAVNPYWYGYESFQPLTNGVTGSHYPQAGDANNRYYDMGVKPAPGSYPPARYDAKPEAFNSMPGVPNLNEEYWYAQFGDAHWVSGVTYTVVEGAHLKSKTVNGIWLRKRKALLAAVKAAGFPSTWTWENLKECFYTAPGGTPIDARTGEAPYLINPIASGTPANLDDYFFLPALGVYQYGKLDMYGSLGAYWPINVNKDNYNDAIYMWFSSSNIGLTVYNPREYGFSVQAFE